jgi:hypothetical protein
MIEQMQSIIQTHKPTWVDSQHLLLTLFNTEEQHLITLAVIKWLEDHAPAGTLNTQAYIQGQFPKKNPCWNPNDDQEYQQLEWYQEALLRSMKEGGEKDMNIS